ncbi:MAG: peptidase [Melioribacteraceae bacterium]|nr:MAG: peptidase [Melioribacteraceae bacterium]
MKFEKHHIADLEKAVELLENQSLVLTVSDFLGTNIEKGIEALPDNVKYYLSRITKKALMHTVNIAGLSIPSDNTKFTGLGRIHTVMSGLCGAASGFFGLPGLAIELPISTSVMMRSILEIAQKEGENIDEISTKLACLEVFALGGKTEKDSNESSGYYFVRASLAASVKNAAEFIAINGFTKEGAPALVRLIIKIAEKFRIKVSEKLVLQSLPFIGAVAGGGMNILFADHFQNKAQGHFIVRRLERIYGKSEVEMKYKEILCTS